LAPSPAALPQPPAAHHLLERERLAGGPRAPAYDARRGHAAAARAAAAAGKRRHSLIACLHDAKLVGDVVCRKHLGAARLAAAAQPCLRARGRWEGGRRVIGAPSQPGLGAAEGPSNFLAPPNATPPGATLLEARRVAARRALLLAQHDLLPQRARATAAGASPQRAGSAAAAAAARAAQRVVEGAAAEGLEEGLVGAARDAAGGVVVGALGWGGARGGRGRGCMMTSLAGAQAQSSAAPHPGKSRAARRATEARAPTPPRAQTPPPAASAGARSSGRTVARRPGLPWTRRPGPRTRG
jgi:hypothetical protein